MAKEAMFLPDQEVRHEGEIVKILSSSSLSGTYFYQIQSPNLGLLDGVPESALTPIPLTLPNKDLSALSDAELAQRIEECRRIRMNIKNEPKGRKLIVKEGKIKLKGSVSKKSEPVLTDDY